MIIAGLQRHFPTEQYGIAHDSTASPSTSGSGCWHVGGHAGQSASFSHCASAHAPPLHAVGHWESESSQTQDPLSQAGSTYETTELM